MRKETPMINFIFRMMTLVMRIRGFFRNKKKEVLLTGIKEDDVVLDYGCGIIIHLWDVLIQKHQTVILKK